MRINDRVYMVGGGDMGVSHRYDCNVYLLDGGSRMAIIDTGVGLESDRIIRNIIEEGKDPEKISHIFLTHSHPDHAGGAFDMANMLGCEIIASPSEGDIVTRGSNEQLGLLEHRNTGYLPNYIFRHVKTEPIDDRETIGIGNIAIQAIFTPGHSICSTCYFFSIEGHRYLCSGDTVFMRGLVAIYNSYGFDMRLYSQSVKYLSNLEIEVLLPGHLGFMVNDGQRCIDHAISQFQQVDLPKSIALLG